MRPSHRFAEMYGWLFRWLGLIAFVSAMFIAAARAQAGDPRSASVKLRNGGNVFSGTILSPTPDGRSLVATCAHGFQGRIGGISVQVYLGDRELPGVLRHHDKEHDVAIVELPRGDYPSVDLGDAVTNGADVETWGYPGGETLKVMRSKVVANSYVHRCAVHSNGGAYVTMHGQVQQGHSGGGLFAGGRLVGTASAVDGQRTLFCLPDALHRAYHSVASGVVHGAGAVVGGVVGGAKEIVCPPGRG